jgi:TatD DNase family protein
MELIDTHCHLDVADFDADRSEVLARTRASGVRRLVIPAVDAAHWGPLLALCRQEPGLYPALGLHPVYLDQHRREDVEALEGAVAQQRPVAVGEIGLDFFVAGLDRARQQRLFEAQLAVARDADLPVLLHVRKSHDQVLATLRRMRVRGGIAHAFNGSLQQAGQYLQLGFKLGFGGTLTYARSSRIRGLAKALPLEAIVLETDAPDIPVAAHRGERNSPEYLPDCLQALAEVRDADPELLALHTTRNACAVLGLDEAPGGP